MVYCASTELGTRVSFLFFFCFFLYVYFFFFEIRSQFMNFDRFPFLPSARLGILGILLLPVILDLCTWNCLWVSEIICEANPGPCVKGYYIPFFLFFFDSGILP